jgi:hypothetical protein
VLQPVLRAEVLDAAVEDPQHAAPGAGGRVAGRLAHGGLVHVDGVDHRALLCALGHHERQHACAGANIEDAARGVRLGPGAQHHRVCADLHGAELVPDREVPELEHLRVWVGS